MKKAEVTAFLSIVFILLISFVASIMESASIQMAKSYRRADMNRAIESVFAEYQKELLEEYDIFSLEETYETGDYSEEQLLRRLEYYGGGQMEQKIQRIRVLTDQNGQSFYEQVIYYMEEKYGLNIISDQLSMTDIWKSQDDKTSECQEQESASQNDLNKVLEAAGGELPTEGNPIDYVQGLKKTSLLELIMPSGKSVSAKSVSVGQLPSRRANNRGYGDFADVEKKDGKLSDLLFVEYLLEHFDTASENEETGKLDYELEYLYGGNRSDRENLEAVAKKLLLLRFVTNYGFLKSSSSKKAEAEALAITLSTLAAVPEVEMVVTEAILLAWAYGESVVDLRVLMNQQRVPLIKSDDSWQLSLSGLMNLKERGVVNDGRDDKKGLSYKDYLRMLLYLQKKSVLRMRALDLIELDLRYKKGLEFFRTDYCVNKIEIKSTCHLRRNVTYQFQTYYGYN